MQVSGAPTRTGSSADRDDQVRAEYRAGKVDDDRRGLCALFALLFAGDVGVVVFGGIFCPLRRLVAVIVMLRARELALKRVVTKAFSTR